MSDRPPDSVGRLAYYALIAYSATYFIIALHFYLTGLGGETLLTARCFPLALAIYFLGKIQREWRSLTYRLIALVSVGLATFLAIYLSVEFMNLIHYRAGSYNTIDVFAAIALLALTLGYVYRESKVIFGITLFLIFYAVYGQVFPGIFYHPGIPLLRVVTSLTIEFETGVMGSLARIGITLVSAFILFQAVAIGFSALESLIKTLIKTVGRKPHLVPQTSVVSSAAVATVSGSGAANVAATGQFTIPLMIRTGYPPEFAGGVECSASLGGLITPPVMASIAFIIAVSLMVSYWDVCIRGFVLASIYYICVALSVYTASVRLMGVKESRIETEIRVKPLDVVKTATFFGMIGLLTYLLASFQYEVQTAAIYAAGILFTISILLKLFEGLLERKKPSEILISIIDSIRKCVVEFSENSSGIVLLLGSLGMVVGLFVISGWIIRLGSQLINLGGGNIVALVGLSYVLGCFLGMGMPPLGTYLILSSVTGYVLARVGVNPWVAQFFAFLVAMTGEFIPPVSVVGAVASRISRGSFWKTVWEGGKLTTVIFLLPFAIFRWPWLVSEVSISTLYAWVFVTLSTLCISISWQALFVKNSIKNALLRASGIAIGLATMFYPAADVLHYVLLSLSSTFILLGLYRTRALSRTV